MRVTSLTTVGAVRASVEELEPTVVKPADIALVKLAEMLAAQIDAAGDVTAALADVRRVIYDARETPELHGTAWSLENLIDKMIIAANTGKSLVDTAARLQSVLESLGVGAKARAAIAPRVAAPAGPSGNAETSQPTAAPQGKRGALKMLRGGAP